MKTHKLDYEKSREFFAKTARDVRPKECYRNIFHASIRCLDDFIKGDLRIAYGYMQSLENVYVRHCFILDKEDRVIDPTIFCYERDEEKARKTEYISFAVLSMEEYAKLLEENSYYPDLCMVLRDEETQAIQEAFKKGLLFVG